MAGAVEGVNQETGVVNYINSLSWVVYHFHGVFGAAKNMHQHTPLFCPLATAATIRPSLNVYVISK